ncbi:hypothetical protein SPLA5a_PHROGS00129 [Salmonella phage SPLA5a]|nr:hypothetical protein SPLA5a_PHROGS00129 [Salmonella phage SPLA5a]
MNKLKCFGREHVIANTSPMPGNRAFVDRTGRKYHTPDGNVIARHYHGYNEGRATWWCEVEDMPGNFVLKPTYALSPRLEVSVESVAVQSPLTGKVRKEKPETMEEWKNIVSDIRFGGHPVFWHDDDFWISTKGIKEVSEYFYNRIQNACSIKPARDLGYLPQGVRGRVPGFVKLTNMQRRLEGKYRKVGKGAAPLLEMTRNLEALKKNYALLALAKREEVIEQAPAPQVTVSVEVDLREHSLKIAKEFYEEKGIAANDEMIRSMQDAICRKFWTSKMKRRIMVNAEDLNSCFDAETKLDAVLKIIQK